VTFRAVAYDKDGEDLVGAAKDSRSFDQRTDSFGGDEPPQKSDDRRGCRFCLGWQNGWNNEAVWDGYDSRKLYKVFQALRGHNVGSHALAEKAADKREAPELKGGEPALRGVATPAFRVMSGHEMPGTRISGGFDEQLTVGTDGLKAMMFNHNGFACQSPKNKRQESWSRNVKEVAVSNELPKLSRAGLANHAKRKRRVVIDSCGSLRDDRNGKMARTATGSKVAETLGKRKNDTFDASDTWGKKMRIEQQFAYVIGHADS
jgi:hypothetical protein